MSTDLKWRKSPHGGFVADWARGSVQVDKVPMSGVFGGRPVWHFEIFDQGHLIDKGTIHGKAAAQRVVQRFVDGQNVDTKK